MANASLTTRDEFVNTSDGWIGVIQIDHMGAARGAAVEPGGSTFLTEEEQILTANAPKADDDNPFANGTLALRRRASEVKNRRPWGAGAATPAPAPVSAPTPPEETGAAPLPVGEAPEGTHAAGEEVATPQATMKPTARRRRS